jgi:hypothetical protein
MNLYQPTITGSLSVSGSVNISGSITIAGGGTISGTASIATTALTASSADNLLVRNTLTAQTLVVQTITSSVDFVTGSTRFGSILDNTHVFSGSVSMNPGGLFVSSSGLVGIGTSIPSGKLMLYSPSGSGDLFQNIVSSAGGSTKVGINFSPAVLENYPSLYPAQASIYAVDDNYSANLIFATKVTGAVANSLTERMRITSAGNVGIGTTNPATKFDLSGSLGNFQIASSGAEIFLTRNENNDILATGGLSSKIRLGAQLQVVIGVGANYEARLTVTSGGNVGIGDTSPTSNNNNTSSPVLSLKSTTAGAYPSYVTKYINGAEGGMTLAGDLYIDIGGNSTAANNNIIFRTTSANSSYATNERMRITSGGSVLINTTTVIGANSMLAILAGSAREGLVIKLAEGAYSPIWIRNSNEVAMFYVNEANAGYLNASAWSYGSDRRIKENIINLEGSGLDTILKLNPVRFDYIDGIKNNIGWIAQDVQEVIPEAVSAISKTNDQLTLKSDYIVPYLVKAIQELKAEFDEYKTTHP